ncbi:MAG: PH domain-containing protein [Candidatus Berkelbacteria bacterium]|nr:PH domain-containing protein [Candidatus Berkelbacteria bacterium]
MENPDDSPSIYFPSQEKEERVFLLIRKHWFNYVPFALFALLMVVPVIAFWLVISYWGIALSSFYSALATILISAYLLIILAVQLYGFVSYYLDVYIVTDRRIVDISQEGFFSRQIAELHLHQVQDVNARVKGIFGTLLHFGDVFIQTASDHENFVFQSIPHPYTVAKQIVNLHQSQIENDYTVSPSAPSATAQSDIIITKEKDDIKSEISGLLHIDDLEKQAKGILGKSSFSERLRNPGLFHHPENRHIIEDSDQIVADLQNIGKNDNQIEPDNFESADDNAQFTPQEKKIDSLLQEATEQKGKILSKKNTDPSDSEGELTEGREINLE